MERRIFLSRLAPAVLCALVLALDVSAETRPNGFSIANARVPPDEILEGGPARDGIRSVDAPTFVAPEEARWVAASNPVLGLVVGDEAHTYPVHLIERHQIVNDVLSDVPTVATYDPLAGSPRAYRRIVDGRTLSFGVSGLIYNHNFLLYDRETESLWVQFSGQAVAGPLAGKRLEPLRIRQETLRGWLARQPRARVLVRPLPTELDYRYSPFETYIVRDALIFPVKAQDRAFHAKELVLGVSVDRKARAYLGSIITAHGGVVEDTFQGRRIRFTYDTNEAVFSFDAPEDLRVEEAYWFAWKAFHPETAIWRPAADVSVPE